MKNAWRVVLDNPAQALFFLRAVRAQRRAARIRRDWDRRGLHVPPLLIASITGRCNLSCRGCYNRLLGRSPQPELPTERLRAALVEAETLGISIVMLAGGEPLLRPDVLELAREFPGILFPVFTNGLLLDAPALARFTRLRNLIPVISLEGPAALTDDRRGKGVWKALIATLRRLHKKGLFHGVSLTVTSRNVSTLTEEAFVSDLLDVGCRVFFYVEYVPVEPATETLVLQGPEKSRMLSALERFRQTLPGLFVALPGDEEEYGGCLAAGRGFLHLSPSGRVEPCPFAPWSDTTVARDSLADALRSGFLARIRAAHSRLKETEGGCALWAEKEWAESLLAESARTEAPAPPNP